MSIRETELITPIDMRPAADSFLQAAQDGQVAVGQAQYYLELDTRIAADQEGAIAAVTDEPEAVTPEPVTVEKGPQRSAFELQLIAEHLGAAAKLNMSTTIPANSPEPTVKKHPEHRFYSESDELEGGTIQAPAVTRYYREVGALMTHAGYLQERQARAKQWPWMYGGLVKKR